MVEAVLVMALAVVLGVGIGVGVHVSCISGIEFPPPVHI